MTVVRARVDALVAFLRRRPEAATGVAVFDAYGAAGGGLLAGGLAYSGLLGLLSACLLIVGLTGFVIRDPDRQAALVADLASRLPPLADILRTGFERVADGAVEFSVIGLLGVAWGVSRFYGFLDIAFARVFRGTPGRGVGARLVRGFVLVGVLIAAILGSVVLGTLTALMDTVLPGDVLPVARAAASVAFTLANLALYVVSVAAIYRWVPPIKISWRLLGRPALVVGLSLSVLSSLFVALQARLLGALELFSGFVVVLATMVWLSLGFQLLLLGAAWVRVRQADASR
jgi:membrane protein